MVMAMINGNRADGGGALGTDGEPMFQNDTRGHDEAVSIYPPEWNRSN